MKVPREEATGLASLLYILNLSAAKRDKKMEDALAEADTDDGHSIDNDARLRRYCFLQFSCYTNHYLETFLSDKLNSEITIDGNDVNLFTCPCCGFNTLDSFGEYDICAVCYWEDDGTTEPERDSIVNVMTLQGARDNFQKFGVMSEKYLKHVEPDRMQKYHSGRPNPGSLNRTPYIDIYEVAENIVDKQGFVEFLLVLRHNFSAKRSDWDNDNLNSYLEGMYGYCYGDVEDEQLNWSRVATILLSARVYE